MKMMIMMDQSLSGSHTIVKPTTRNSDYHTTLPQSAKPGNGNRYTNLIRSKSSQPGSNQFRQSSQTNPFRHSS